MLETLDEILVVSSRSDFRMIKKTLSFTTHFGVWFVSGFLDAQRNISLTSLKI